MTDHRPAPWWREKNTDHAAQQAIAHLNHLRVMDSDRVDDLAAWEAIYNDQPCDRFSDSSVDYHRSGKSRMPILPGMVDATLSRIGRARPLPSVLTTNGTYKLKRKAKRLSAWLAGQYKALRVHEVMRSVLQDALVLGTGVVKTYYDAEARSLVVERVWVGDIWVPPIEAERDQVRTLYQTMAVDRRVLADQFPKSARYIMDEAPLYVPPEGRAEYSDLVEVVECWRIGTRTSPGRHMIACGTKALASDEWTEDAFPFDFLRWRQMHRRFFGQGMVESGAGLQSMINETAQIMEDCFRLSFPAIFAEEHNGFSAERVSNLPWMVYRYKGVPPQFSTPPPFSDSYYRYLDTLSNKLYETQGVSQLAASSSKPAGLNSGKALLVFQDVESERYLIQGRAYEDIHVRIAERIVRLAEQIYQSEGRSDALDVLGGRDALEAIRYRDVRFGDHPWEIQVYPVTSLSHSPSGRLEQVQELLQMGIVNDPAVARELLDYPDLERFTQVESAARELVEKMIDDCLDERGEQPSPNPYMDLSYAMRRATLEENLAQRDGAPAKALERLRDFIGAVETLQARMAPPMPMMPEGGPEAPPPGTEAIPDVSPLPGMV